MNNYKKALLFRILSIVGLIAPMLALLIIKKDTYFIKGESTKMSIGCILALIFTFFALKGKLKEVNSLVTLGIIWVLCFLLETLIKDLLIIIPCCMLGNMIYMVLNNFYKNYNQIHQVQKTAKIDQYARNEINNSSRGNV